MQQRGPPQRGPPPGPPSMNGSPAQPPRNGPPPPGQPYSIPPSHPSHPQHGAWLHQQQLQQQQQQGSPGGPQQPPSHYQPQGGPGGPPPNLRLNTQLQGSPRGPPQPNSAPPGSGPPLPSSASVAPPGSRPPPPPGYPSSSSAPGYRPSPQQLHGLPGAGPSPSPAMRVINGGPGHGPGGGPGGAGGPPPGRGMAPERDPYLATALAASGAGPITATATNVGPGLSKLTAFSEALSVALESETLDSLRAVVANFFTDTAVLKYGLYDPGAGLNKVFEIPIASFPRFQHIHLLSGCLSHSLSPSFIREFTLHVPCPASLASPPSQHHQDSPSPPPGRPVHVGYLLRADEAIWHSRFEDGVKVELLGTLTTHFVVVPPSPPPPGYPPPPPGTPLGLRIESMDFDARGHEELIPREAMIRERVERFYDLDGFKGLGVVGVEDGAGGGEHGSPPIGHRKSSSSSEKNTGVLTRRRSAASASNAADSATHDDPTRGHKLPKSGAQWQKERLKGVGMWEGRREFVPEGKVGSFGITEMGMRCLEIAESVAQLHELIGFSLETGLGPLQSLARYSSSLQQPPPQYGGPGPPSLSINPHLPQRPPTAGPHSANPNGPPSGNPFLHNPNGLALPPSTGMSISPMSGSGMNLSGAPIASTSQNPSTNPFYASATVPPPPSAMDRPPSRGAPLSPGGPAAGAGKRKTAGQQGMPPPRTPTPGFDQGDSGDYDYVQGPGSPNKVPRQGGGGRGRGRGR